MQVDTSEYGLTPAQYHAGLERLWPAMPQYDGPQDDDVFTLAALAIEELQAENARLREMLSVETMTPEEVDSELKKRGIAVTKAAARVHRAMASAKTRAATLKGDE